MTNADCTKHAHWAHFLRHSPLAILCDLDGTLVPFAESPEAAVPSPEVRALVSMLGSLPGVTFAIVSGRSREVLESNFPETILVAEHGTARRGRGAWEVQASDPADLAALSLRLEELCTRIAGARLERKSVSLVLHYRNTAKRQRDELTVEATALIEVFVRANPTYECSPSVMAIELRPSRACKATAVPFLRELAGAEARLLAIGDDITDESMFGALSSRDESVWVRNGDRRMSSANWVLNEPEAVVQFLSGIIAYRTGKTDLQHVPKPIARIVRSERSEALLVVSNRLPSLRNVGVGRSPNVGGLVSALRPILTERRGSWLGWSGDRMADGSPQKTHTFSDVEPPLVGIDLTETDFQQYYNGFCNGSLWPLFHCFPGRVRFAREEWNAYVRVHEAFADAALQMVDASGTVWVHDYHLFLLARSLRRKGHKGPLGHFLHVPFPPQEIFAMLPHAEEILDALLEFDLLGFHTPQHAANFLESVGAHHSARVSDDSVMHRGHKTSVGAFPIGIIAEDYQGAQDPEFAEELEGLMRSLGNSQLILGVDRLDYTKGIPERLLAFGHLLETMPEWRGKVSLVQVSVPSRADVPYYAEQRARVEEIVGRINGQFGEANWVPVRYLYRSYAASQLGLLYRIAQVGYVTPLRDGMNLVAKEYVAAQDSSNPGVLVLSKFAGAAVELKDALLTNPFDTEGMAECIDRALRMPLEERIARHAKLLATVEQRTAQVWASEFLSALASAAQVR
jgi:alpha,alpha-trehalose-phosphate synthase [UDP-forming]/trehalose-phosphatase